MPVIPFSFNDQVIEFSLNPKTLKVNATQMAKVFDAKVNEFLSNQGTQNFITECLKSGNSRFLGIEKESDLYESVQQKGTWMHKVLALKFAAWLDPAFELWVYMMVEKIVFADYEHLRKSFRDSAERKLEIEKIKEKLRKDVPEFQNLEILETEERQSGYVRGKFNRNQIKMFMESEQEDITG